MRNYTFVAAVLVALATVACQSQASSPAKSDERVKPEYDAGGRLTRLTYDKNGDGKVDTWGFMDGSRVVRVESDENGDGNVDSWEYHLAGAAGQSNAPVVRADKTIERIERATQFDGRVSRKEFFEAGVLARVEEDTDSDGHMDKWETYMRGALTMMALDTQGRGTPDRRLVYNADGSLSRIEADPTGTGEFKPLSQ